MKVTSFAHYYKHILKTDNDYVKYKNVPLSPFYVSLLCPATPTVTGSIRNKPL